MNRTLALCLSSLALVSLAAATESGEATSGKKELWDTYSPTFDKMGSFELIDMKRFGK
jgi:hypothetical protein